MTRFERFVTLGDSTAEGVGDPYPDGRNRGFGDRLAERLAEVQGSVAYANLAVSGYMSHEIRARQLAPALAMRPDLVAIMAGMNDLLIPRFDEKRVAADIEAMQRAFVDTGATVLAFTLPDATHRLVPPPIAGMLSRRVGAISDAVRRVSAETGAIVIDLASHAMATDPRMWNRDRLHGNPESHDRLAAACAEAIGLPGADGWWRAPLPPIEPLRGTARLADDLDWGRRFFVPWALNKLRGRPGFEQRVAKHRELVELRR